MRQKTPSTLLLILIALLLLCLLSLYNTPNVISGNYIIFLPGNILPRPEKLDSVNQVIREKESESEMVNIHQLTPVKYLGSIQSPVTSVHVSMVTESILLPAWEVLVVVSTETPLTIPVSDSYYSCLYPNKIKALARFSGILPFTNQTTFKCDYPLRVRRRKQFVQPRLINSEEEHLTWYNPPSTSELLKWNFIVYDTLSTEEDVVLFVKGLNSRQGINKSPNEFNCVFWDDSYNTVKTAVTSSIQEVFRCAHPNPAALSPITNHQQTKVTIEMIEKNILVPSIVHYTPPRKIMKTHTKSLLCASTMVYNVAKFLREWVTYHAKIGVEKFIIYDNESDDDLVNLVKELNQEGYNVHRLFWIWPKTQEAGFSHVALYAKQSCTWMMYLDVDEFLYSPSWNNISSPSDQILKSLLPTPSETHIGQVSIKCNDFGPSGQVSHPVEGVTQGYTCRQRFDRRHKSIVLLEAIDHSLLNAIHHFWLKPGYKTKSMRMEVAVVNHYKYQAWSEFKNKFRRRVSAYVVDWMQSVNPKSKDRTPGLGFEAVEPIGWVEKFCEVKDERLKRLTQKWFGTETSSGYKMAWQW